MASRKTKKPKANSITLAGLGFEMAIRATLATGKAPRAPKRKPKRGK